MMVGTIDGMNYDLIPVDDEKDRTIEAAEELANYLDTHRTLYIFTQHLPLHILVCIVHTANLNIIYSVEW